MSHDMSDLIQLVLNVGIFLGLMLVGFIWGTINEKNHYQKIKEREHYYRHFPAVPMNFETVCAGESAPVVNAQMVCGSVVLAEDFFKAFLAGLKTFFGGNLTSYESLMDRARREAILRMKEKASGADIIVNLRLDTSSIGKEGEASGGKTPKSIEVLASGTAIYFHKEKSDRSL